MNNQNVVILNSDSKFLAKSKLLSEKLNLKMVDDEGLILDNQLALSYKEEGLTLLDKDLFMYGDFKKLEKRINNLHLEMQVKACKLKGNDSPILFDATAGLGEDSFILAAAGFRVKMYEYNSIIFSLLEDALERAKNDEILKEIRSNIEIYNLDSIEVLKENLSHLDVIFLDPMFPERTKSALIKKKFQLLQKLELPCSNEKDLFISAINSKPNKIVVKRPLKGQYLNDLKPDYSYSGKAIRYDCYINLNKYE